MSKILIIGQGGREHAIGVKIIQDNPEAQLFFAPGNGGTAQIGTNVSISSLAEKVQFAKENHIQLTIVGPENDLVEGIVDAFQAHNLRIFGPHKKAALLEGSKMFAKDFMKKYGVKTADYKNFNYFVDANEYIKTITEYPIVVKADGLAAGKGVIICHDAIEAEMAVKKLMLDEQFGGAGKEIVIESFLEGYEVSILSIFNGNQIYPFISAKDHKKIGEGETGLNTGGMGVIAPNPLFTKDNEKAFITDILTPTLNGLLAENLSFAGIIFFGLMVTTNGVYLLEYNTRFGDPETQATLELLESNLLENINQAINMHDVTLKWKPKHSCCVVMASGGYPLNYETGLEIAGLSSIPNNYYIAGASLEDGILKTSGGRVLNIMGTGNTQDDAIENAYKNVKKIQFDYTYYRKDIGK